MTHSTKKNSNNTSNTLPNATTNEKWGFWKSTKIFLALFIVFSILFYSILHISFIQKWFFPGTAILAVPTMSMMNPDHQDTPEIPPTKVIQFHETSNDDENRPRSNSTNIFQTIKKTMTGGGSTNHQSQQSVQQLNNHHDSYNDNIFTDPPNF